MDEKIVLKKLSSLAKVLLNTDKSAYLHINELIKLSAYEDEWAHKIEEIAKQNPKPFSKWFPDGKDRVYIPFKEPADKDPKALRGLTRDDVAIIDLLHDVGCDKIDYIDGYCYHNGRLLKIGKFLKKILREFKKLKVAAKKFLEQGDENIDADEVIRLVKENISEASLRVLAYTYAMPANMVTLGSKRMEIVISSIDNLLDVFDNSRVRASGKIPKLIVISQNPHDIAKMSTERRGWRSCMRLPTKEMGDTNNASYPDSIICEVQSGGLIAYLINESDDEIHHPLARIWIRRFESLGGTPVAIPERTVYGTAPPQFMEQVKDWLSDKHSFDIEKIEGLYERLGSEYSDTFSKSHLFIPEN